MASDKLSYEVSKIPQPATNHDAYLHATLIETRLIRMTLERIAAVLERQVPGTLELKKAR